MPDGGLRSWREASTMMADGQKPTARFIEASLNRMLREEFVRIYSEPVLPNFLREQMKAHPGVLLPALPPPGDLDIRQVLSSPYFFA
jgi:DNA-directed RNA polymerase